MTPKLNLFLDLLRSKGWSVRIDGDGDLDESFRRRYPNIPEDYLLFLGVVTSCVNAAETVWFNCRDDFSGKSSSAFAWNEFEIMALEETEGDDVGSTEIREFWDKHLPFLFSVKGDYACLAFCLSEKNYGSVVATYAPDLDAVTSPLFRSFREFIDSYSAALKEEESNPDLNDFI
jgi:hypothetical protein